MPNATIYKAVIDNALDAFLLTKPDGTILEANNAACEMFGYTQTELQSIGRQGIIDHTDPCVLDMLEERQKNGKVKRELTGIHKNGHKFPIAFSSVVFTGEHKEAYTFSVIRDISERKHLELELYINEQRFRSLVENSGDIIMQVNEGYNIVYISPAVKRVMGFEVSEVIGKPLRELLHEETHTRHEEFMEILANPGKPFNKEYRVITKDGRYIWVEATITNFFQTPGVNGLIINQRDITEKKEKEQQLLDSNERFFYATKAISDAIWDWNIKSNEVVRAGDGLKTQFGYDPQEASKDIDFWINHVHPDDLERMLARRNSVINDPSQLYWDDEYRVLKSDGNFAYIYEKGYIIRDKTGKAVRIIGATHDTTQRRESEALLYELNSRLKKRAEELASSNIELERFAYVASHDLQEPLRMVISFLQLFKKKYEGKIDTTADQYIHFAVDGAERMKKLIFDLLEYSRVGSNREGYDKVDINLLVKEVLEVFNKNIEDSNAKIIIEEMPEIVANKIQMLQLFQNLIGNALKYHGNNSPEIIISCKENSDNYLFGIRDNGIGIDPAYYEKIFVIFQRLHSKSEYGGTGIGLAICKKIVERHGGNIWIESESGKGSIFYFTISKEF